ncbi:MAG TPA: MASE1 domain-containing protein [Gaiellaceae bacterium]|nr:MASE1 domain-containing protein [Gaiellaceae bacterium]
MTDTHVSLARRSVRSAAAARLAGFSLRRAAAVLALAAVYVGAARLGQSLRYTASVSAVWPPVGLGIAALYLGGLRLWPGIFIGELIVNGQLLAGDAGLPVGSLAGQQLGNMAEVVVGAWLLRRLIGPRAPLDRGSQVVGMAVAVGAATAISATVGTLSMLAGDVITLDEAPTFWRTWWLGDTSGALVVLPFVLTWLGNARAAFRRMWTVEGGLLIATVIALVVVAVTSSEPLTYLIFPALIWAAFRFGPPGVTLATLINAGVTIGITAHQRGAFFRQPIDDRTLTTQLYILIGALTALFLSAAVSERQRTAAELVTARRREGDRALEDRRRIARDLHDSVSQALFSSLLHTRIAERALDGDPNAAAPELRESLRTIGELTRRAQREMRSFIFEWGAHDVGAGLVSAFARAVPTLTAGSALEVEIEGPDEPLPLTIESQTQLFTIGREALANVVKHSGASAAFVRLEARDRRVIMEIGDDGCGFDATVGYPGRLGLESMRSRAREIDADLEISSRAGHGTLIRVEIPAAEQERAHVG